MKTILITPNKYPKHKGGVPYYNKQLAEHLPIELITLEEFSVTGKDEIETALLLNKKATEHLPIKSIIIGDGIWGNIGIDNKNFFLISISHGLWSRAYSKQHKYAVVQKEGYLRSKHVIACSNYVQRCVQQDYECNSLVVPTMVEPSFWKDQKKQRTTILLLRKPGWEVSAWNDEVERFPNVLKMKTYDENELVSLYSSSKCFIHLTKYEGNSLAILKALSCGCPVVTTPVGLFGGCVSGFHDFGAWVCRTREDVLQGISYFTQNKCEIDKTKCNNMKGFIQQWKLILTN